MKIIQETKTLYSTFMRSTLEDVKEIVSVCAGHSTIEDAMICHDRAEQRGDFEQIRKRGEKQGIKVDFPILKETVSLQLEEMDT